MLFFGFEVFTFARLGFSGRCFVRPSFALSALVIGEATRPEYEKLRVVVEALAEKSSANIRYLEACLVEEKNDFFGQKIMML